MRNNEEKSNELGPGDELDCYHDRVKNLFSQVVFVGEKLRDAVRNQKDYKCKKVEDSDCSFHDDPKVPGNFHMKSKSNSETKLQNE